MLFSGFAWSGNPGNWAITFIILYPIWLVHRVWQSSVCNKPQIITATLNKENWGDHQRWVTGLDQSSLLSCCLSNNQCCSSGTSSEYHKTGNFDKVFNLANWQDHPIKTHQFKFNALMTLASSNLNFANTNWDFAKFNACQNYPLYGISQYRQVASTTITKYLWLPWLRIKLTRASLCYRASYLATGWDQAIANSFLLSVN